MTVLVVTSRADTTADFVVDALNRADASVLRLDLAEFPQDAGITAHFNGQRWRGRISTAQRSASLAEISGIYYRRPTSPVLAAGMSEAEREFASREIRLGYGGLLAALPERLWINHPRRQAAAEASKPWQLEIAAANNLPVPRTLITASPDEAARFVQEQGGFAALKPFGNGGFSDADGYRIAYARRVSAEDVRDESIRLTAHQLQEWIDTDFAVRMVTVDERSHTAAILPGSDRAQVDWRSDNDSLDYKLIEPPPYVHWGIQALHSELGLRFSASDFLVDHEGVWWFLEVNPGGQWAWMEVLADDVSSALASALVESPSCEHTE